MIKVKASFLFLTLLLCLLLQCVTPEPRSSRQSCRGRQCRIIKALPSSNISYRSSVNPFVYTGWSRWSRCDTQCATYRFRNCLFPTICGDRMTIHEKAFCYRRGSYCEVLHLTSIQERQNRSKDRGHQPDQSYYQVQQYQDPPNASAPGNTGNRGQNSILQPFREEERRLSDVPENRGRGIRVSARNKTRRNENSRKNRRYPGSYRYNYLTSLNPDERVPRRRHGIQQPMCGIPMLSERNYTPRFQLRILGGREAQQGRWPWQVAVLNRAKEVFCGGTLIAPRWILTAAHCVRRRIHVTIGEHHIHVREGTEKQYRIKTAFIHPEFDPETVNNDIALLLLPEPVSYDNGLACLPEHNQPLPTTDTMCTILGWGKQRHSHVHGTSSLQEGKVPIVSSAECRITYPYEVTPNMFCAGYKAGRVDSCAGDSGGPILCPLQDRWTIFGVTSFGDGCGRKGKYGIYAKVSNYISWIRRVIKANESVQ